MNEPKSVRSSAVISAAVGTVIIAILLSAFPQPLQKIVKHLLVGLIDNFPAGVSRAKHGFDRAHFIDHELRRTMIAGGRFVDQLLEDRLLFGDALALAVLCDDHPFVESLIEDGCAVP